MKVKELKKGDYFTRKATENPTDRQVLVRGDYDRTEKKYECYHFDDVNDTVYISGNKEAFVDFVF